MSPAWLCAMSRGLGRSAAAMTRISIPGEDLFGHLCEGTPRPRRPGRGPLRWVPLPGYGFCVSSAAASAVTGSIMLKAVPMAGVPRDTWILSLAWPYTILEMVASLMEFWAPSPGREQWLQHMLEHIGWARPSPASVTHP